MIDETTLTKARGASIVAYLSDKGHNIVPGSSTTAYTVFSSPFTNEKTPSFKVKNAANTFTDYSAGFNGDIITLIERLEGVTFGQAVEKALSLVGASAPMIISEPAPEIKIRAIAPISNLALIEYLQKRGIDLDIARVHCKQINYTVKKGDRTKFYFGIGFPTERGGWAVRNEFFKGFIGEAYPKLIPGKESPSTTVNVFEGFFDFLTALTRNKTSVLRYDSYILNSCVFMTVLPQHLGFTYNCFVDNDRAGSDVVEYIKTIGTANDMRHLYAGCKDFNEFHTKAA